MAESRKGSHHVRTTSSHGEVTGAASAGDVEEIVVTLHKGTHEVIKIARLDASGHRKDLSEQDASELAGTNVVSELIHVLDEAYQAGVAEGLGAEGAAEDVDDDVLLWRLLVSQSAERSMDRLGVRRMLLRPLLLRRFLRRQISEPPAGAIQRRMPIADPPRNGSHRTPDTKQE